MFGARGPRARMVAVMMWKICLWVYKHRAKIRNDYLAAYRRTKRAKSASVGNSKFRLSLDWKFRLLRNRILWCVVYQDTQRYSFSDFCTVFLHPRASFKHNDGHGMRVWPLAPSINFSGLELRFGQEIAIQQEIGGVMTVGIFQVINQILTQTVWARYLFATWI